MPLTISYAETLIAAGQPAEAHELLLDLLNNVDPTPEQLRLIARAANAEGDVGNAYFYMSYYYASIGDLLLAIGQVRLALETPDVHTVDRSRFAARLEQLIDYLPDEERDRSGAPRPVSALRGPRQGCTSTRGAYSPPALCSPDADAGLAANQNGTKIVHYQPCREDPPRCCA